MASIVQICNLALSRLGTRATIASLDESSTEARICKANYADCRDTLLRDFDWNFARRVETLALRIEAPPSGWSYVYSVPNKCARFRGIWSGPRPIGAPVDWAIGSVADSSGNDVVAVFTNQSQADGWYTRIVENSELFSAGFVKALSWRLAEAIALPITTRDSLAEVMARRAAAKVAEGLAAEANEGIATTDHQVPDFLAERGYTD
jgi:hypothetical protein